MAQQTGDDELHVKLDLLVSQVIQECEETDYFGPPYSMHSAM